MCMDCVKFIGKFAKFSIHLFSRRAPGFNQYDIVKEHAVYVLPEKAKVSLTCADLPQYIVSRSHLGTATVGFTFL